MGHNDIINRLTEIQDCIRYNKTFDACVKIDSLQRMLAEEKLTSDSSDYAKCGCGSTTDTDVYRIS